MANRLGALILKAPVVCFEKSVHPALNAWPPITRMVRLNFQHVSTPHKYLEPSALS